MAGPHQEQHERVARLADPSPGRRALVGNSDLNWLSSDRRLVNYHFSESGVEIDDLSDDSSRVSDAVRATRLRGPVGVGEGQGVNDYDGVPVGGQLPLPGNGVRLRPSRTGRCTRRQRSPSARAPGRRRPRCAPHQASCRWPEGAASDGCSRNSILVRFSRGCRGVMDGTPSQCAGASIRWLCHAACCSCGGLGTHGSADGVRGHCPVGDPGPAVAGRGRPPGLNQPTSGTVSVYPAPGEGEASLDDLAIAVSATAEIGVDPTGEFRVRLSPGVYIVTADMVGGHACEPQRVEVRAGRYTEVTIICSIR